MGETTLDQPLSTSDGGYILADGVWKHGRFYGNWPPHKYICPIDSEELDRLDIFHTAFLIARGGCAYTYTLESDPPPKILDLGTGTGIWPIDIVERIQPPFIPRGLTIKQFDLEEASWDSLLFDCDLIHMRLLFGSIETNLWPETYAKISNHLAPGKGYVEHVEVDWTPQWEGDDIPVQSPFMKWSELFLKGMDRLNRSARVTPHETKRMMHEAGLTNFKQETIKCYVNPWSPDQHEREVGNWFNLVLYYGLEAMSLMPMVDGLSMDPDVVRDLCREVKKEICALQCRAFCTIYIWTAKKPPIKGP